MHINKRMLCKPNSQQNEVRFFRRMTTILFFHAKQSSALKKYFSKFIIQKNYLGSSLHANSDSVRLGGSVKFQILHKTSKCYPCRWAMYHDESSA